MNVDQLQEYVVDEDDPSNQVAQYYILYPIQITDSLKEQLDEDRPFILGRDNGVIRTNVYFTETMKGYFELSVVVNDSIRGHRDIADVSVSYIYQNIGHYISVAKNVH